MMNSLYEEMGWVKSNDQMMIRWIWLGRLGNATGLRGERRGDGIR